MADAQLHETLLRGEPRSTPRRPTSPWAYPLWAMVLVSVFVAYHVSVLLVWNGPAGGLARGFHRSFLTELHGNAYFRGTGNNQSWAMFAPDPARNNKFIRVLVTDQAGELYDFSQDIWQTDRYPSLWYDRRAKINRNMAKSRGYQRTYGAWVCREWERQHDEPAKSVTFVRRWTRIPEPDQVIANGGWDPWKAKIKQREEETVVCGTIVHGQLSPELRARYGMEPVEDGVFRPVRLTTWWTQAERKKAGPRAALRATPR